MKRKQYYIGADIGQGMEPTAIAVVARDSNREDDDYPLECSYLQELPGGTTYPDLARRISEIEAGLLKRKADIIKILVDVTGQGQPVIDLIRRSVESEAISAQFTAGAGASSEGESWRINQYEMVANLKIMLQTRRLLFPGKTQNPAQERAVSEMLRELENFTYNPPAAEEALEVKTGPRNALITALGLAIWLEREWRVTGPIGGVAIAGLRVKNPHGW